MAVSVEASTTSRKAQAAKRLSRVKAEAHLQGALWALDVMELAGVEHRFLTELREALMGENGK